VLVGVGAVRLTGLVWLDPVVAFAVAGNIVRMGVGLVRRSMHGLMDAALPADEQGVIREVLDGFRGDGVEYHALRTRRAAARRFVSVHILVPGEWSVQRGHDLLERVEAGVCARLPNVTIFTHLEPLEDPAAWGDEGLDRPDNAAGAGREKGRSDDGDATGAGER